MGSRQSKSQRLAGELRSMADRPIRASNPFSKELKSVAKHMDWLELVITGLSHKDRNNIAKIERHRKDLVRRLDVKDLKIGELKVALRALNEELKELHKNWESEVRGLEKEKRELTPELREEAERDFIKGLQTFNQKQLNNVKAFNRDVESYSKQRVPRFNSAATDSGWTQVLYK